MYPKGRKFEGYPNFLLNENQMYANNGQIVIEEIF